MSFEPTATIQRAPHDGENPYAQISRALIRDEKASPLLRFMLIFLLSQKDGWKITPKQVINHFKDHGIGRDKVYKLFNEGIELGYILKEEYISSNNLKRTRYVISEHPKFKKCFRRPAPQDPEPPHPEETYLKKEHPSSKEEVKKNCPPDCAPVEFLKYPNVTKMPRNSFDALVREHGKEVINEYLERLNDYADIDPPRFKRYANHATVIKNWIKRETSKSNASQVGRDKVMDLVNRIKEKNIDLVRKEAISILREAIEFKKGMYCAHIRYDDKEALKKIESEVRRWRLNS